MNMIPISWFYWVKLFLVYQNVMIHILNFIFSVLSTTYYITWRLFVLDRNITTWDCPLVLELPVQSLVPQIYIIKLPQEDYSSHPIMGLTDRTGDHIRARELPMTRWVPIIWRIWGLYHLPLSVPILCCPFGAAALWLRFIPCYISLSIKHLNLRWILTNWISLTNLIGHGTTLYKRIYNSIKNLR